MVTAAPTLQRDAWNTVPIDQTECLAKNARTRLAMSSFFSSRAKWPASSRWISLFGRSRLNASATAAMNEGSFRPQTTKAGGLCSRNRRPESKRKINRRRGLNEPLGELPRSALKRLFAFTTYSKESVVE